MLERPDPVQDRWQRDQAAGGHLVRAHTVHQCQKSELSNEFAFSSSLTQSQQGTLCRGPLPRAGPAGLGSPRAILPSASESGTTPAGGDGAHDGIKPYEVSYSHHRLQIDESGSPDPWGTIAFRRCVLCSSDRSYPILMLSESPKPYLNQRDLVRKLAYGLAKR